MFRVLATRSGRTSLLHRLAAGFATTLVLVALGEPVRAQEQAEVSEGGQLRELREQISQARERVGEREREERQIFDRLEALDQRIDRLAVGAAQARRAAESARTALAKTRERETLAAAQVERTRKAMSRRVVGLYKTGEVGPLRVLFSSSSLPELMQRASVLRKLLEHDANLVDRYRREHEALESARGDAKARARVRDEAVQQLELRSAELGSERATKTELLAVVRSDRAMERAVLVELERAARALEEKLVALGETSRLGAAGLDSADFAAHRGELRAPVRARVVREFGLVVDSQFGTETFNKGVEFGAALGDSVRAVAFGEVRYAGWFRGYGKIVILDHGSQYFTVSGHLADIYVEVGQTVDLGDTLATVGDSGSLSGPSFYFEVRQGGKPLDPSEWLQ